MRILILTFYFRPDLCAGSFRNTALVDKLVQLDGVTHIDVLTTMPNRYGSYRDTAQTLEMSGNVTIHRLSVPAHRSGMIDQSRSFVSFARQALSMVGEGDYDIVFASSSRLMTAFLGAIVSVWKRAPLYLDIRDIFTDTMDGLLKSRSARTFLPLIRLVERWTMKRASRINVVSHAFQPYFAKLAAKKDYRFFPNGIDDFFLARDLPLPLPNDTRKEVLIVCAGNMGEGQGLHRIIPQAAKVLGDRAKFRLIGDGGRRPALERSLADQGIANVEILPPVSRAELMRHYEECDILFLHLNDVPAFEKVLPSKIFEYGALGRPILAGVSGYAREFLRKNVSGSFPFRPCDANDLLAAFNRLQEGPRSYDRAHFIAQFNRMNIAEQMAEDILRLKPAKLAT